jgi:hypothetical protein
MNVSHGLGSSKSGPLGPICREERAFATSESIIKAAAAKNPKLEAIGCI